MTDIFSSGMRNILGIFRYFLFGIGIEIILKLAQMLGIIRKADRPCLNVQLLLRRDDLVGIKRIQHVQMVIWLVLLIVLDGVVLVGGMVLSHCDDAIV